MNREDRYASELRRTLLGAKASNGSCVFSAASSEFRDFVSKFKKVITKNISHELRDP
jgi:hypothetical protein